MAQDTLEFDLEEFPIVVKPYEEEVIEYFKLKKTIKQMVKKRLLKKELVDKVYDLVVDEYLDMGENPDQASINDCVDIADSSRL